MRHFPQLSTGALVQMPFAIERSTRTVINESEDGSIASMPDTRAERIQWSLQYVGLTDNEADAIGALFESVGGRRSTFVFLDPGSNLLRWSEDLRDAAWVKDGLSTVRLIPRAEGCGAAFELSNSGQTPPGISQLLRAPGHFHYAFSFYARAASPVAITAERLTAGDATADAYRVNECWQRFCSSGAMGAGGEEIRFRLSIPAGTSIDLYGIQVEAQPAASAYKPTYSESGVYENARFADDVLQITTYGANNHSALIRLTAGARRS